MVRNSLNSDVVLNGEYLLFASTVNCFDAQLMCLQWCSYVYHLFICLYIGTKLAISEC